MILAARQRASPRDAGGLAKTPGQSRVPRWRKAQAVSLFSIGYQSISVATGAGEVSLITPLEGAVGSSELNQAGNVFESATDLLIVKNSSTSTPTGLLD